MATNLPRSERHRRRVVLKADKVKKERSTDGDEMYAASDADANFCAEVVESNVHRGEGTALGVTPLISKAKSDSNIIDVKRERGEIFPVHSTPFRVSSDDLPLLHKANSIVKSQTLTVNSEGEREEREGEEEREGVVKREEEDDGKGEGESEAEGDRVEMGICKSRSDDVFLLSIPPQSSLLESDQTKVKVAHSRSDESGLRHTSYGSDRLPPLPASARGRRRPYTSPGRNSSSCSSDSYPSPIRNHTVPLAIADGSGGEQSMTKTPHKPQRTKRKGRSNHLRPEDRPPDLNLPSPLHFSESTTMSSVASHATSGRRTLLSTDSLSSAPLTPLLTASLRKGGSGSRCGSSSAWQFDAEAQLESCFPDRHMRILLVTWNMQQLKDLPESLDDLLLPLSQDTAADMFVIGTQESTASRREWEVLIQQTLGPSYVLVQSSSLGVIYLLLYIRRDIIWFCSAVSASSFATRPGTLIKTKGAVGISFTVFGSSFLFITSHFTAHEQSVTERNSDMHRIAENLSLVGDTNGRGLRMLDSFDHIFWCGDFNYRVALTREQADQLLATSDFTTLLLKDQLTQEILHGNVFQGFSEQPISFAPSYKFDTNSDTYDTSEKKRVPSWTDRILFKARDKSSIIGCEYSSCHSLKCSDHRPVYGIFRVKLVPSKHIEGIPDSVVTFDREIYIQAHKQRKLAAHLASIRATEETDHGVATPTASRTSGRVTSAMCTVL